MTKEEMQELKLVLVDVVETRLARTEEGFDSKLATIMEQMATKDDLAAVRADMATKDDLAAVRADMATKDDLEEVSKRLRKLEIKVEHNIEKAIQVTMEGHSILNRKLDSALGLENRVEMLEHKMSAVEYYIREQRAPQ
ncbi:MAG: hypothetical protein FWG14_08745 [Peptococcaceae bacterium]|nr:hypothetical protein [Peptococcaceae bacterium]